MNDDDLVAFATKHGILAADVDKVLAEVLAYVRAKVREASEVEARAIAKGVILGLGATVWRA